MRLAPLALAAALLAPIARAEGFDYYLLALSWSPSWCAAEGAAEGAEQCDPGRDLGFILHGLWPQYEEGWPEYCDTARPDPTRAQTAAMADVTGSAGLAWHAWNKHGRCSGLAGADYLALARAAFEAVTPPDLAATRTSAAEVEKAFLDANPALAPEALVVTCRAGRVEEVRICLDRGLEPRACGEDVARRECRPTEALDLPAPG